MTDRDPRDVTQERVERLRAEVHGLIGEMLMLSERMELVDSSPFPIPTSSGAVGYLCQALDLLSKHQVQSAAYAIDEVRRGNG